MMITFYIFISLFTITSIIHCYSNYKKIETIRVITKPFCMLFLALSVIMIRSYYPLLYIALFFALIGDVLLLFKKNRILFILGGTCFAIEHVLNFITISNIIANIPFYVYIITYVSIYTFGLLGLIRKEKKLLSYIATSYFNFHLSNIIISIIALILTKNILFLLVIFGYMFFAFSDFLIAFRIFYHDFKNRSFYLIVTYLIAQVMIMMGLVFIL